MTRQEAILDVIRYRRLPPEVALECVDGLIAKLGEGHDMTIPNSNDLFADGVAFLVSSPENEAPRTRDDGTEEDALQIAERLIAAPVEQALALVKLDKERHA